MFGRKPSGLPIALAVALAAMPQPACAQDQAGPDNVSEGQAEYGNVAERTSGADIVPYIEASQVITARIAARQ